MKVKIHGNNENKNTTIMRHIALKSFAGSVMDPDIAEKEPRGPIEEYLGIRRQCETAPWKGWGRGLAVRQPTNLASPVICSNND